MHTSEAADIRGHSADGGDVAAIDRKIAGVVAGLESGGDPRALGQRLNDLEAERRALLAQMPEKETDAIALHANAAERYRQKVADVHAALSKGNEASREAITLVRELIERITVEPTPPEMISCQCSTGSWLVTMVEPRPCRSSIISSRSRRGEALLGWMIGHCSPLFHRPPVCSIPGSGPSALQW